MIEQLLGHYRLLSKIGAGGMGEVYRAKDEQLGREVALKVLPRASFTDSAARARLLKEARTASVLNHPHICTIHEVGEAHGQLYIAMEHIEGQPLSQLVPEEGLPAETVVRYGVQLADALSHAHHRGVVHRDLKASNIIITPEGRAKLLDFGLAKRLRNQEVAEATRSQASLSETGEVSGTLPYMAPEVLRGEPVDARSDLWALGVVLYKMATGELPFQGKTGFELSSSILREPLPPLPSRVPTSLQAIIQRCLAKEPGQRYQQASEVRAALEPIQSQAAAVRAVTRPARLSRRSLLALAVGVFALLAALIGPHVGDWIDRLLDRVRAGSGTRPAALETERPIVAVLPLANISGDSSIDHVGVGIAHTLVTSLSRIPSVTVVFSPTTLGRAEENQDIGKIARDLGTTFVVTGSVQRSGNRLHLTLNLVGPDNSVVWGSDSEGTLSDLFALQHRLAESLSQAPQLRLSAEDRQRLETPPTLDKEAFGDYAQARTFLERADVPGNPSRAIQLFQAAIRKDPQFALAYAGMGEAYWVQYRETKDRVWTTRAREATLEALRLDPDQAGVRYSLAVIYHGTGRSQEALDELQRAIGLQPNNDDAHRLLGQILADQGRLPEAVREFQKAIEIRPNFHGNHSELGIAYYRAGRFEEAAAPFRRVTELQPDLPFGFHLLGVTYHTIGDLDQAVTNYQQAIRLGPSPASYSNLGTVYYRQGKFAEAAENYEQAIQLQPKWAILHRNLGDVYQRMGRTNEARAAYQKAMELTQDSLRVNPKDARALGMLAVCEAKLGRHSEAARHAAQAVRLAPTDGEVLQRQAVVYALAGKTREAMAALQQALESGYSAREAREDDDLTALRHLPEFSKLLEAKSARVN